MLSEYFAYRFGRSVERAQHPRDLPPARDARERARDRMLGWVILVMMVGASLVAAIFGHMT